MSIIEKLGITPIWDSAEISMKIGDTKNQTIADLKCALAAPEMFEALCKVTILTNTEHDYVIKAIEKACYPKKWEQIKELI